MTNSIEHDSAGLADDPNEDTIELLLSPEQRLSLSRAAAEAQSQEAMPVESIMLAPPEPPLHPTGTRSKSNLKPRWPRVPFEAATVLTVVVITLASAAYRSAKAPPPRAQPEPPPSAPTAGPDPVYFEPEGEPVRVRNPFDASEIFEFPPGTPHAAAQKSVANLLLERGRDRLDRRGNPHRSDRSAARGAAPIRQAN